MEKLVLIGGGGHCKSVLDAALRSEMYSEIVITDPILQKGTKILGCPVAGDDSLLPELKKDGFINAFVSVGSIQNAGLRMQLVNKAGAVGFRFPVIVDPSAVVSRHAQIEEGTFVGKHVIINAAAKIGRHCILNTGCVIEHECRVDDFTHISVGAILCGNVQVGTQSFIGAGSTVIQEVKIGDGTVIGAGSTVLVCVGDNRTKYGVVAQDI